MRFFEWLRAPKTYLIKLLVRKIFTKPTIFWRKLFKKHEFLPQFLNEFWNNEFNSLMSIKDQTIFRNYETRTFRKLLTLVSRFMWWYLNKEYLTLKQSFEGWNQLETISNLKKITSGSFEQFRQTYSTLEAVHANLIPLLLLALVFLAKLCWTFLFTMFVLVSVYFQVNWKKLGRNFWMADHFHWHS